MKGDPCAGPIPPWASGLSFLLCNMKGLCLITSFDTVMLWFAVGSGVRGHPWGAHPHAPAGLPLLLREWRLLTLPRSLASWRRSWVFSPPFLDLIFGFHSEKS